MGTRRSLNDGKRDDDGDSGAAGAVVRDRLDDANQLKARIHSGAVARGEAGENRDDEDDECVEDL